MLVASCVTAVASRLLNAISFDFAMCIATRLQSQLIPLKLLELLKRIESFLGLPRKCVHCLVRVELAVIVFEELNLECQ